MTAQPLEQPLVSVVILTWNSKDLLPRAVESVCAQTYERVEIIVVDNASTDGTAELARSYDHVATTLLLDENTGFARGMNAGYDASHGDICVLMNCDAVLRPDVARRAVDLFARHPDVGVIGANIWRLDRDAPDWRFWDWDRDAIAALPFDGGVVALDRLLHVRGLKTRVPWQVSFKANGACPLVRRATIEDMRERFGAAPFDPVFDTYGEDVDFAFKTWTLGWRTMFAADLVVGHVRSYASELDMWDKRGRLRVNLIAERYINAARYLPPAQLLAVLTVALATDVTAATRQRRKGDRTAYADLRTALARILRLRPGLLRFRRRHQPWRRIDFRRVVYLDKE